MEGHNEENTFCAWWYNYYRDKTKLYNQLVEKVGMITVDTFLSEEEFGTG